MDLLSRLGDKSIDWAVIDPEYGIDGDKPSMKNTKALQPDGSFREIAQKKYEHKNWDSTPAPKEFFEEIFRVTNDQIIWGANYYDTLMPGGRLVWDKLNGKCDQYACEIAYVSSNIRTDMVYYMWSGFMQGVYCGKDVKRALVQQGNKKLNESRIHPTQKPVILYKYILSEYVGPNKTILDTGVGSGSLIIAFVEMCEYWNAQGYDISNSMLVCCENDHDMYELSNERIYRILKPNLFSA